MAEGNTTADAILLGRDERGYFISARGSIRAQLCYPLRDAVLARLDEAGKVPAAYADLSECRYMDSTFIGLLVGIDKKLHTSSGGRLHVLRPSPECLDILGQIGLRDFLLIEDQEQRNPPVMSVISPETGTPGAEFVLRAHEALMETSEEARRKFSLLQKMLEKKLSKEKTPRGNPGE
jgi:anti-anti-sigma factor